MTAHIVVSDAGFLPTTRQMALALADELTDYFTPYWAGKNSGLLLRLPRLGAQFARRSIPAELEAHARSFLTANEFARVGLGRLGVHALDRRLIWRRNELFDRRIAQVVPCRSTVVSQYGASLATFERARRVGTRTVLDYPIARMDYTQELLAEEARLRPEFAETIIGGATLSLEPRHLSRIGFEVELADLVVVGSRFAAESFQGVVDPERVVTIPYGVDIAAFHPQLNDAPRCSRLRVLFAGSLTQRKGIAYVLEALELLDATRFELTLVGPLIGRGVGLARYEGRFRHLKGVRPQDMPYVYRGADVLVLPSLVEGSALVVLEAMASGLPVIVTPNVGADRVRDGVDGFVVPIRAPAEIAARLELLADDLELRVRMGQAGRERVLGSDWSHFRRTFRELLLGPSNSTAYEQTARGGVAR